MIGNCLEFYYDRVLSPGSHPRIRMGSFNHCFGLIISCWCILQDRFESVNRAYEFLCSRRSWASQGPNPDNIVLILRTQSILFHRYSVGEFTLISFLRNSSEVLITIIWPSWSNKTEFFHLFRGLSSKAYYVLDWLH